MGQCSGSDRLLEPLLERSVLSLSSQLSVNSPLQTFVVSWATPVRSLLILSAILSLSSADVFQFIPEYWPGVSGSLPQLIPLISSF